MPHMSHSLAEIEPNVLVLGPAEKSGSRTGPRKSGPVPIVGPGNHVLGRSLATYTQKLC